MSIFGSIPLGASKEEAARVLYASDSSVRTWDSALPQGWVDHLQKEYAFDPVSHFVWLYRDDDVYGYPAPVSEEGFWWLCKHGLCP